VVGRFWLSRSRSARARAPLPLLACPVGVAELLVQRREPLVQAGRLLVGDDRKLSGRVGPLGGAGGQRHPSQHLAGHLTHQAPPGPGGAAQPLERGRRIQQLVRHQRPLACSITTRCSKATCNWRARRPWV